MCADHKIKDRLLPRLKLCEIIEKGIFFEEGDIVSSMLKIYFRIDKTLRLLWLTKTHLTRLTYIYW